MLDDCVTCTLSRLRRDLMEGCFVLCLGGLDSYSAVLMYIGESGGVVVVCDS